MTPDHALDGPAFVDRREIARDDPARSAHHDAIYAFARASEVHDGDTGRHVLRIRSIVEAIALALGFTAEDAEDVGYDAMLHDVGKLRVPADVLAKPDRLSEAERTVVESHTLHGEQMIADRPSMRRAARIARSHHEHWDGSGYPDGLAGEAIPLEARITAAADLLDALVSDRSYKPAWSYERAMAEVVGRSGVQLDPSVVEAIRRADGDASLRRVFENA